MPKTRINCPNCRQPITADIQQVFDVGQDPGAKQQFLSGAFNLAQCPHCGFQGSLAMPLVYHDPEKELLLTYFPAELGLPVNEQERIVGPIITRITNSLPQEKRKAYLLRPQTMFTLQSMVERVLEADGITKEMIEAQQQRLSLLQRLANASDEAIAEIAAKEDALLDGEFYMILNRLLETAMVSGNQPLAQRLSDLQRKLLPLTTVGRQILEQSQQVEAAIRSLQEAGQGITRQKLLDLVLQAPTETQLSVFVSLARPAMDYEFFQLLSDRVDQSQGTERERLMKLRERLLEMTRAVDQQAETHLQRARQTLNAILQTSDVKGTLSNNLQVVDEFFVHVLDEETDAARKQADLERLAKLNQIREVIEQASAPPPELIFIEDLVNAPDEATMQKMLEARRNELTPEFMEVLTSLAARPPSEQGAELSERIQSLYRLALRHSMQANLG